MTPSPITRVLLIDDDEEDFIMLKDHLSEIPGQKFSVDWKSSFDLGKAAFLPGAYDICFMDYRLGGRTGIELLKEVLADGTKIPIILLTGYGEPEVDREAMRLGAADFLVKDQINPPLLEKSIRYSVHRAKTRQELLDREAQIVMQDRLASVGLLASSLAHEIGTPLGVIRGRAEFLESQTAHDPMIKKNVDVIIAQIDRVTKLIRSLLSLARGDEIRHAEEVHLNLIVEDVLELMGHELRKHEIVLKNRLNADIPIAVRAEAGPLHQVFLNLIVNSVHAIESAIKSGKRSGHQIEIFSSDSGSFWQVHVKDSGCGISEKNKRSLFTPFFTTKDIGVGTGLGLVTSYRIIQSWGGAIEVESTEGQGATFTVKLPKSPTATLKA